MVDADVARDALRRCVLFCRVADADLDACVESLRVRRFRRDETVFHQGDPGDALHVVVRGTVKIVLPTPGGGEPAILATLGPGTFFGELALLDAEPRSASAVALEPAETLVLGRAAFDHLLETAPTLRRALLAALAGELRRLTDHVEGLHFLDLSARLARRIGDLVRAAPDGDVTAEHGELRVPWPYTQAELAGMIGGSRESVNRILTDFAGRGLVRVERDALVVADLVGLEAAGR